MNLRKGPPAAHPSAHATVSLLQHRKEFGRRARDTIAAAGGELLYEEYPLPHTIDPQFALRVRDWLAAKLG